MNNFALKCEWDLCKRYDYIPTFGSSPFAIFSLQLSDSDTRNGCLCLFINPLTPEINPSARRCLTRIFTGDFAS
jgi:hypothetical protein